MRRFFFSKRPKYMAVFNCFSQRSKKVSSSLEIYKHFHCDDFRLTEVAWVFYSNWRENVSCTWDYISIITTLCYCEYRNTGSRQRQLRHWHTYDLRRLRLIKRKTGVIHHLSEWSTGERTIEQRRCKRKRARAIDPHSFTTRPAAA